MLRLNGNHLTTKKMVTTGFALITASMSINSLIQKLFNVGLVGMAASYVSYYRKISYFIFGLPASLLNVHLPVALIDFWTLSFLCAGAYVRTKNLEGARAFRRYNFSSPSLKLRLAIFFLWGFTGFGLIIPFSVLSITTYTENDITRDALTHLGIVLVFSVLFYAINAFAPSA